MRRLAYGAVGLLLAGAAAWAVTVTTSTPTGFSRVTFQSYCAVGCTVTVVPPATVQYVPSPRMTAAIIECVGGGGGGGGQAATTSTSGRGGGGGGGASGARKAVSWADVPAAGVTVTIGAGGTGGAINATGVAGGDTSVGSLCIGKGGTPGTPGPAGGTGLGGAGSVGDLVVRGGQGMYGSYQLTAAAVRLINSSGGIAAFGYGFGRRSQSAWSIVGLDGEGRGGGGAGGVSWNGAAGQPGGDGSSGIVTITEFIR